MSKLIPDHHEKNLSLFLTGIAFCRIMFHRK